MVASMGPQGGDPLKPIKVLALTKYGRVGASSRMRSWQYHPWFERAGIQVTAQALLSDEQLGDRYQRGAYRSSDLMRAYTARLRAMQRRQEFDVVWIEKEALPWVPVCLERVLLRGTAYVLDYDDAIFHNYDLHRWGWVRRGFGRRLDKLMATARLVVGGNGYLAQRARDAGAPWVEVIPTVIDLDRYVVRPNRPEGVPTVVWIGSPSTSRYLSELATPLATLAQRIPFKLRVIGVELEIKGVEVECIPWTEASEVAAIAECDVGVMPLSDSPWERGKCGYKLIQYMACGLPVVASPVGVNIEIVKEGENGWLAGTADDWVERLQHLLTDQAARERMGQAGRAKVEASYCIQKTAPRMVQLLQLVAQGR